jgi:putative tricarboxylic transport membrane protein
MQTNRRRTWLKLLVGGGVATLSSVAMPLWAQTSKKGKLAAKLRIVIPAPTRTSLDEAGRALGDALVGMSLCDEVEYDNKEGKGGLTGLAHYTEKYGSDPNAFFVGDTTLVGALALQKPAADLSKIQAIARLTSDTLAIVVASNSPLKTVNELADRLRSNAKQAPLGIGSAGSAEHMFAGLIAKSAGSKLEDAVYLPFSRNFELIDAILGGKVAAGIGGYAAFAPELASGKLRALGVSSRRAAYGVKSVREQGLDVDISNWSAVFTGAGVAPARRAEMVEAVKSSMNYELWKKTLKESYREPYWMAGPDLASFIDLDVKTVQVMMQLLKLKA